MGVVSAHTNPRGNCQSERRLPGSSSSLSQAAHIASAGDQSRYELKEMSGERRVRGKEKVEG